MTEELEQARGLLKAGDIPGLLRHLRGAGEALPLGELAGLVAEAARRAGFADLAQAAAMVAEDDGDIQALYAFGYACIERGACYLAVRPLARAMELAPDSARQPRHSACPRRTSTRPGRLRTALSSHTT